MSIDWFRSWHGAPTDSKWLLIARNASKRSETQVTPGVVSAVFWALLDHASQANPRGSVDGFDVETYAVFSGFDADMIANIIQELKDKNLIASGALAEWEKRQPKREDNSTKRVRAHRNAKKHNETQGNARVDKEKSREEKKESVGAVAPKPTDGEAEPKSKGRKPSLPMPEIFPLSDRNRQYAIKRGFVGATIDLMFDRFKNHHQSKGSKFADWDAAWRTWVDNQVQFNAERNPRGQQRGMDPRL